MTTHNQKFDCFKFCGCLTIVIFLIVFWFGFVLTVDWMLRK